jgi:hypothetical protein
MWPHHIRPPNIRLPKEIGAAAKSSISPAPGRQNAAKARRIRRLALLEPLVPQRHITNAAWNRSGRRIGAP